MKEWIAKQLALKMQHNTSQAAFTNQCKLWKDPTSKIVNEDWKDQLPKDYPQALSWLERSSGYPLVAYDRCPNCSVVIYRCEFKEHSCCPRCQTPRYKPGSKDKVPQARLLYNPMAAYVQSLWGQPDLARCFHLNFSYVL